MKTMRFIRCMIVVSTAFAMIIGCSTKEAIVSKQDYATELSDEELYKLLNDVNWKKDPEVFAKLFFGEDLGLRSQRREKTFVRKPKLMENIRGSHVEWSMNFGINPAWYGVGVAGRTALDRITGNMAAYSPFRQDDYITGWIWLMNGSRLDGTKKIDWTEMTWGIPPQSNVILKMKLESALVYIDQSGMLIMFVTGSELEIETSFPKIDWPVYITSPGIGRTREVKIVNTHDFHVKIGLRSEDIGRDFIVPPEGEASTWVMDGLEWDIYFHFAADPGSLYKGERFKVENQGVKIEIGGGVDGDYRIERIK